MTWRAWAALLVGIAAAAIVVDLGIERRLENADTFIPILVSLQRWTAFYWGQDRFGMLLPLVAVPVGDPLANLLLQRALGIAAGLCAVVAVCRYFLPARDAFLTAALAIVAMLLSAPEAIRFLCWTEPYGLGIALATAGLLLIDGRPVGFPGLVAALALVLLGSWVNVTTASSVGAMVVARAVVEGIDRERRSAAIRRRGMDLALLLLGLAAGLAAAAWYRVAAGVSATDGALLPMADWPRAWRALAGSAWQAGGAWPLPIDAACALLGFRLLSRMEHRPLRRAVALRSIALACAALASAAVVGTSSWVEFNLSSARYLIPSLLLLHVAAISPLGAALAATGTLRRGAILAAAAAVPLSAIVATGFPSLATARNGLDAAAGRHTPDVLGARCDVVSGEYWSVWPVVWHAALAAHERGSGRAVWGWTARSQHTDALWGTLPREARFCALRGEANFRESPLAPKIASAPPGSVEQWPTLVVVRLTRR